MNFQSQCPGVKSYLRAAGPTRWHVAEGSFCSEPTELGGRDSASWLAKPETFMI